MNNELKEILDDLRNKDCYVNNETILTFDEAKILLDYITNLEKENRQTKLLKERYQLEKEAYKSRNEKAIEYIWSTKYEWGDLEEDNEDFDIDIYKLLNILQGSDKE